MIFHGFYQTHGHDRDHESLVNPRFDFPPGINFEPWFADHHARFAIESARVSEFVEPISPAIDVALVYPLRTIWSEGQTGRQARELGQWAARLSAAGIPFLLIDERDLADSDIGDGRLRVGQQAFSHVVLPAVTTLRSSATTQALRELLADGVRVIASGPTPQVYQDGRQSAADDWAQLASLATVREAVPPTTELPDLLLQSSDAVGLSIPTEVKVRSRIGSEDGNAVRLALFALDAADVAIDLPPGTWRVDEWIPTDGTQQFAGVASSRVRVRLIEHDVRLFRLDRVEPDESIEAGPLDVPSQQVPTTASSTTILDSGWRLEIPSDAHEQAGTSIPIAVSEGWERQGLSTFAGIAEYVRDIPAAASAQQLVLPAVAGAVEVHIDGECIGTAGWMPYRFVLPPRTSDVDPSELRIRVAPPAANRYYAGTGLRPEPEPYGLLAPPLLIDVPDSDSTDKKGSSCSKESTHS